jgi:two-component system sensor histidine kinase DesK
VDRDSRGTAQHVGAFVWLILIVFPMVEALTSRRTPVDRALTVAGAVVFAVVYVAMVLSWRGRRAGRILPVLFVALIAMAAALTLYDGGGWGFLFTYCAAGAGLIFRRFGSVAVLACSVLAAVTSAVGGASAGNAIGWVVSSVGIGMLLLVMHDLRVRNEQLCQARAELARLAVAEERERFSRDLHDLLGHSLSLIALKSELAGRLLGERPADAARELSDVEAVARKALGEVREAVSGYRRPTLDGELKGAEAALAAAGIEFRLERDEVGLDSGSEAVLAWSVREGVTNAIRHSRARSCWLMVSADGDRATVRVIDDGLGPPIGGPPTGNGLSGLQQRAQGVGGTLAAEARPGGGFRLEVTVPLATRRPDSGPAEPRPGLRREASPPSRRMPRDEVVPSSPVLDRPDPARLV